MSSACENPELLKARILELEAKLADSERRRKKAEHEKEVAEREKEKAKIDRNALRVAMIDAIDKAKNIFVSGEHLMCGDAREDMGTSILIQTLIGEVMRISQEAHHLEPYRRVGNEGIHRSASGDTSKEDGDSTVGTSKSPLDQFKEQVETPLADAAEQLGKDISNANKTMISLGKAAANLVEDNADPALVAANAIMKQSAPTRIPKKRQPSSGRQSATISGNRYSKSDLVEYVYCPECHGQVATPGAIVRKLRTSLGNFEDRFTQLEQTLQIGFCVKCKRAASSLGANTSVPITPSNASTNSQDLVLEAMAMQINGMPRNRAVEVFFAPFNLGHDSICEMERRWLEVYGHLIVVKIKEMAAKQGILIFDETPYRCLELQELGVAKTRTKSKNAKTEETEEVAEAGDDAKTKLKKELKAKAGYVFCAATRSDSPIRLAVYDALRGRSASAIQEKAMQYLNSGNLKVFATDGLESYDSMLRQLAAEKGIVNIKRAACWTHWRRVVIKAVEFQLYSREVGKMSIEQAEQHFIERFGTKTTTDGKERPKPVEFFLFIIEAIRTMYAHEASCKRQDGETDEDFYKRVADNREKNIKPLVEEIDVIVKELAKGRVEQKPNGTWKVAHCASKQVAAALTYYLNNRDALHLFLAEPLAPLDTNVVERAIRPMACLEGNSGFRQSLEQMQTLCDYFTLFETARLCGIERPEDWLIHYGRMAFKHCFEKRFTEDFKKNGVRVVTSGFRKWNMAELMSDFDITPFLPWNYQVS